MYARVCVCARAHILHGILYRMRRVCEHSGNPPCVSANIQRMQLSIPATGHLSAPLFFSYWHVPWEKTNWPAFISALTMDSFFFFSTFYDICCTDACMCTRLSVWLHYFWILLSYFADFFFSRKRDGFSREKGKFSWRLVYGQKVSTVRWEFYRATGCLIAEGRDANGFKLINESYTVYNIYIYFIYICICIYENLNGLRTVNNKRTIKYNELVTSN